MQFHFIDDNVSDPTLTEDHAQDSHIEQLVHDQDKLHDKTQDIDCTYVTTDSLFLEQRLLQKQGVYRTVSCPDLEKGVKYVPLGHKTIDSNNTSLNTEDNLDETDIEQGPSASTSVGIGTEGGKLAKKVTLEDLLYHPGALRVPQADIIAAPGLRGPANNNLVWAAQRLQNMT